MTNSLTEATAKVISSAIVYGPILYELLQPPSYQIVYGALGSLVVVTQSSKHMPLALAYRVLIAIDGIMQYSMRHSDLALFIKELKDGLHLGAFNQFLSFICGEVASIDPFRTMIQRIGPFALNHMGNQLFGNISLVQEMAAHTSSLVSTFFSK